MDMMENHYFNGETWANFLTGEGYQLKNTISKHLNLPKTLINNTDS
jgi:hypothetical protein